MRDWGIHLDPQPGTTVPGIVRTGALWKLTTVMAHKVWTITVMAIAMCALAAVRNQAQQGSLDLSFPEADQRVRVVAADTAGRLVMTGYFTNVGGFVRNGIARLNPDGTIDDTFDP